MSGKTIKKRYTWATFYKYGLFVSIAFGVFASATTAFMGVEGQLTGPIFFVAVMIVGGVIAFIVYYWSIVRKLARRSKQLMELSRQYGWQWQAEGDATPLGSSSLYALSPRDMKYKNYIMAEDWSYVDFSYMIYQQNKNGEEKVAEIYYGVMATQLPRPLPNVLFDSKALQGSQFARIFDKKQLHQLEGNFNEAFDVYFPENYTIDSLSFINPDVMLALLEAKDYEIEIIGDQLLMYGPLHVDGAAQIRDMSHKLAAIKKELLDYILTYRDQRLPYKVGKQGEIHVTGQFLKRRGERIWISLAIIAIYLAVRAIMSAL